MGNKLSDKFNSLNHSIILLNNKKYLNNLCFSFFIIAVNILIWLISGYKFINSEITVGGLVVISIIFEKVLIEIQNIQVFIFDFKNFLASLKRINEIISCDLNIVHDLDLVNTVETIELKNISHSFKNTLLFKLENIILKKGDILLIEGKNGSGKTTLLNIILNIINPLTGNILINGVDINKFSDKILKSIFSIVTQEYELFTGSIKENICLGEIYSDEDIIKLANCIGIKGINERFINSKLLDKGANISLGQKQKILLLRAFLKKSDILILDEFDASLDNETKNNTIKYINKIKDNHIIIISTHEKDMIYTKRIKLGD